MKFRVKHRKINRVIALGLALRLLLLVFVMIFSEKISLGFIGSSLDPDDVRYEAGAKIYAESAQSVIDPEAFRLAYLQVGDNVGDPTKSVFETTPLWYWICCFLTYVFRTTWSIRLLNILFGCLSIKVIYSFARQFSSERTALLAGRLMAYMPYQIFFCCFAYKDQFVLYLTFELFYLAAVFRKNEKLSVSFVIKTAFSVIALLLLRSGIAVFTIIIALFIGISTKRKRIIRDIVKKKKISVTLLVLFCVVGIGLILVKNVNTIIYKVLHYQFRYTFSELKDASINFAVIDSPAKIWKLPIVFLLSIILPIGKYSQYNSWYGIVASLNYISIPIMIGNAIYLYKHKFDKASYYGIMAVYLISAVASINICRHFYSFLPICYLAYADGYRQFKTIEKRGIIAGSCIVAAILLCYYYV